MKCTHDALPFIIYICRAFSSLQWKRLFLFTAPQFLSRVRYRNHLSISGHRVTIQTKETRKTLPFPVGAKHRKRLGSVSEHRTHTYPRNTQKRRFSSTAPTISASSLSTDRKSRHNSLDAEMPHLWIQFRRRGIFYLSISSVTFSLPT